MKPTVETKICELVKLGHERAAELHCAESAALVRNLASQLEVQLVRSNALAAKLSMINGLMDAAEQANKLAQEATEKLVQERDALAAENAGLKDEISNITFMRDDDFFCSTQRAQEVMGRLVNVKTPATDAFLAEVRAQGVEMFAHDVGETEQGNGLMKAIGRRAIKFAAQLRKGVQS